MNGVAIHNFSIIAFSKLTCTFRVETFYIIQPQNSISTSEKVHR